MNIPVDHRPKDRFPWSETLEAWVVHRYEDVFAALISSDLSASAASQPKPEEELPTTPDLPIGRKEVMGSIHQHTAVIRQTMKTLGSKYCSQVADQSSFDLQQQLVYPWCNELAFQLLGVEPERYNNQQKANLLEHADNVFRITEGTNRKKADASTNYLAQEFLNLIIERRAQLSDNFFSSFVDNDLQSGVLLSPVVQLFVGTTTSLPLLLGNVFYLLLKYPPLLDQCLEKPKHTMHELIRLAGPTQYVYRVAIADVQIGDRLFKRGDRLAVYLSMANLDEWAYPSPQTVDTTRERRGNLSLGMGQHVCMGTNLIREAVKVLPVLALQQLGRLELQEVEWGGSRAVKGVIQLKVKQEVLT